MRHPRFLLLLALSPAAWSQAEIVAQHRLTHENGLFACARNGSCDLQGAELTVTEHRFSYPGSEDNPTFRTSMELRYQTRTVEDLRKFAVVQFIRGCHYATERMPDGTISKHIGRQREFFGAREPFRHRDWVVDSVDVDPMFNNMTPGDQAQHGPDRHGLYRVDGGGFAYQTQPTTPFLAVRDLPSGVSRSFLGEEAVSLEFKACLFMTQDVPVEATPTQLRPEEALFCLNWQSKWSYDYEAGEYKRREEMDPFCLE